MFNIIPEISIPVSDMLYAEWNWKIDSEPQMLKFAESLKKNGLIYRPVLAQKLEEPDSCLYEVLDGNHRLRVIRRVVPDTFVLQCYFLGRISLAERMRVAVELNEWKFSSDNIKLAEVFSEILKELPMI